jgi:hypothetical protein
MNTWVTYLDEVLGLKSFVRPLESESFIIQSAYKIVVHSKTMISVREKDLLDNILKAAHFADAPIEMIQENFDASSFRNCQWILFLSDSDPTQLQLDSRNRENLFQIPSLESILARPELKKTAWQTIKEMMKRIQS